MFNQVAIIGNLTREWETKFLPSGTELNSSAIATTHKYKKQNGEQVEETMFLDISSIGKQGSILKQYTSKGSKVFIQGRLVFQQWKAQDGTNRSRHALSVTEFKFLDSKQDNQQQPAQQNYNAPQQQNRQQPQQNNYEQNIPTIDINNDIIPF